MTHDLRFKELPPVKTSLSQELENGIYSFSNGSKNSNNLTNNNYKLNVIPRKKSVELDDNDYIDPTKRNKLTGRTNYSSNSELNGIHHLSNNNISYKNNNNFNHNSSNNNNNLAYQEQEENEGENDEQD